MNQEPSLSVEVLFTPADFAALKTRNLRHSTCVVFDILRATSSMVTALTNGARSIIPVEDIPEALALRSRKADLLLAGERHGLRIKADLTGGIDFDLGNSPREFNAEAVRDRSIVMTTTNGTRALRACAHADRVLVGSFLNLSAVAKAILTTHPDHVLIVCSGTFEEAAYEDALGAGALCELLWAGYHTGHWSDSALIARRLYLDERHDLVTALGRARNGRRLLAQPELRQDVDFCARCDTTDLVATMKENAVQPS